MTPDLTAQLLARFPRARDLIAEQQGEDAKADAEWAAKEREWQAAADAAKAEGKPAPRPLKREESKVYHHHGPTVRVAREDILQVCRWLRDTPELMPCTAADITVTTNTPTAMPRIVRPARTLFVRSASKAMNTPSAI